MAGRHSGRALPFTGWTSPARRLLTIVDCWMAIVPSFGKPFRLSTAISFVCTVITGGKGPSRLRGRMFWPSLCLGTRQWSMQPVDRSTPTFWPRQESRPSVISEMAAAGPTLHGCRVPVVLLLPEFSAGSGPPSPMAFYYCLARSFPLSLCLSPSVRDHVYRWCPSPCIQVSWQQWPSSLLVSVGGDLRSATLSSVLLCSRCGLLACPPPTPKTSLSSTSTEYYLRLLDSIDFVWLHPRSAEFVVILWPPWITCSSGVQRLVGFDCLCDGSCPHYTNRCCHLTLRYGRHRSYPACLAAARHLLSFGVLSLFIGDSTCPTPFPQSSVL